MQKYYWISEDIIHFGLVAYLAQKRMTIFLKIYTLHRH